MRISKSLLLTATTALLTLTCDKVPDFCGGGELYDPSCAFCYGSQPYRLCTNEKKTYNPLVQGCTPTTDVVGTRCSDGSVVSAGTPCGGYTLTTAVTPANRGSVDNPAGKTIFEEGDPVTLTAVAEDADYEFAGWTGAMASASPRVTYVMAGAKSQVTMVAMFRPKGEDGEYTLLTTAYPHDEAGSIRRSREPDRDGGKYSNGTRVTVTAEAKDGFVFDGWSGSEASRGREITLTMEETKTLVAMFIPAVQTLVADVFPPDGGAVYIESKAVSGNMSYDEGKIVELWAQANEAEGYGFVGWGGAAEGQPNPARITVAKGGMTVAANFAKGGGGAPSVPPPSKTYTLTVNKSDGDGGTVRVNGAIYDKPVTVGNGQEVSIAATANAEAGYEFAGWAGVSEPERQKETIHITMDGNKALTANFTKEGVEPPPPPPPPLDTVQKKYKIQVSDLGNASPPILTAYYVAGDTVTITAATALYGAPFTHWTSTDGGTFVDYTSVTTTFIMPANDVAVKANFEPKYHVSYFRGYDGISEWDGSTAVGSPYGGYIAGATVNISAIKDVSPPGSCYQFSKWTTASEGVTFANERSMETTFIMPANGVQITANFDARNADALPPNVPYGTFVDNRDDNTYYTVTIGGKTWMAQNLNYSTESGSWRNYDDMNCVTYGRLYDWATANTVCPSGWHLPTREEWGNMLDVVDDQKQAIEILGGGYYWPNAGRKLNADHGWNENGNGTDEYGFSALPGGRGSTYGIDYSGNAGFWWTATDFVDGDAYFVEMTSYSHVYEANNYGKSVGMSVRCVSGESVPVTPPPNTSENILKNGDFSKGTDGWVLNQGKDWGDSEAELFVTGGKATVKISKAGTSSWEPELSQYGIALEHGMKYRLAFNASAEEKRKIGVVIKMAKDPWTGYWENTYYLDAAEQPFSVEFEMKEGSDSNASLSFNIGGGESASVTISDVKLTRIGWMQKSRRK